jgi:hypothetical protein
MMKNLAVVLAILIALFMFTSSQCKHDHINSADNPYGLPNVNELGTMACLINDTAWICNPTAPIVFSANFYSNYLFQIIGDGPGMYATVFNLHINVKASGFRMNEPMAIDSPFFTIQYWADSDCIGPTNTVIGSAIDGNITLTQFDTTLNIVSGTFSGTIPLAGCDTLHITYGRFSNNFSRF